MLWSGLHRCAGLLWSMLISLAVVAHAAVPVQAQTIGAGETSSALSAPVLTIDPERLFAETLYGRRVQVDLEARAGDLAAENRRIEAELVAEERELTERRPTLPVGEFRALADAFDAKVDAIREAQDAKSREVVQLSETGRQEFLAQIVPVLSQLMLERGGTALFDRRNVFLSLDAADITDAAIARIDEVLGDGTGAEAPR